MSLFLHIDAQMQPDSTVDTVDPQLTRYFTSHSSFAGRCYQAAGSDAEK